jgi:tRNA pseudouridine55 synthase
MIGVIDLDKPVGPTSHDMVALVRRLSGTRRIGHAGTLDPLASGVLPILVGAATRLSEELTAGRKRYVAVIRLGHRSETDDGEGPITAGAPPPELEAVSTALEGFVGTFDQRPPAYSARKSGGQVAHRAARRGVAVELASRTVTIHDLRLLASERGPDWLDVSIDVATGPGTYIRSLARDLGERLGCGGYLRALRRTEAAGLTLAEAWTPERLEAAAEDGRLQDAVIPAARVLTLDEVVLDDEMAAKFMHGQWLGLPERPPGRVAVVHDGELIGIGQLVAGWAEGRVVLRVLKVLAE